MFFESPLLQSCVKDTPSRSSFLPMVWIVMKVVIFLHIGRSIASMFFEVSCRFIDRSNQSTNHVRLTFSLFLAKISLGGLPLSRVTMRRRLKPIIVSLRSQIVGWRGQEGCFARDILFLESIFAKEPFFERVSTTVMEAHWKGCRG